MHRVYHRVSIVYIIVYTSCIHRVSSVYPACIHHVYPSCIHCVYHRVSIVYPSFIHRVSSVYPSCIYRVSILYTSCIHRVSSVYPACIHRVSIVYPSCISSCIHRVSIVYPWCIHHVSIVYPICIFRVSIVRIKKCCCIHRVIPFEYYLSLPQMIDLFYFLIVIMVMVASFGIASLVILYPNTPLNLKLVVTVLSPAWWNVLNQINRFEEIYGTLEYEDGRAQQ